MTDFQTTLKGYLSGLADVSPVAHFVVKYRLSGGTLNTASESLTVQAYDVVLPSDGEQFVPGSVSFAFGDKTYLDRNGQLYHSIDPSNGNGIFGGTIDYATGKLNLQAWQVGSSNTGTVLSSLTTSNFNPIDKIVLRTAQAPLKPASFGLRVSLLNGTFISAQSDDSGVINTAHVIGSVDNNTGIVVLGFGSWVTAAGNEAQDWYDPLKVVNNKIFKPEPVIADTLIYNAVSYTFLPLEASILGLDPARLPTDGRIPVFHKGNVVVIVNDQTTGLTATSNSSTDLGRTRLSRVIVKDLGGNALVADKWAVNLDTGVIAWGDLAGVSQPLSIVDRIQDEAVVADVQINGTLTLSKPLTHNFPLDGTLVSSAVVLGDVFARASNPFDQQTWTGVWENVLLGNQTNAQYNHTLHAIEVTNTGAIEERWLIQFVTTNLVNVIGEHVGQVLSAVSIFTHITPLNPATNEPYFTLNSAGWGSGWSAGNCLRFNTVQAAKPIWIIQSVLPGEPTSTDYRFCLCFAGDVDAP